MKDLKAFSLLFVAATILIRCCTKQKLLDQIKTPKAIVTSLSEKLLNCDILEYFIIIKRTILHSQQRWNIIRTLLRLKAT